MTAAELMEQLRHDPEHRARERGREQRRQERAADYDRAAQPVRADLAAAGFDVESIADLYEKEMDYRRAIPVLLKWLPKIGHRGVKESIVRAVSVSWAKPDAARLLINEFRELGDAPEDSLRWAIGNALEVVADEAALDDLIDLARDSRYGRAREMIVVALGNMRDRRAVDVLIDLLDDQEVAGHAIIALGRQCAAQARPYIEPFLDHPQEWIRNEARTAMGRIDNSQM